MDDPVNLRSTNTKSIREIALALTISEQTADLDHLIPRELGLMMLFARTTAFPIATTLDHVSDIVRLRSSEPMSGILARRHVTSVTHYPRRHHVVLQ